MSKLDGKTLDIEEQNTNKIKELFPEVDTDGKIDFEKLKQVLGEYVDDSEERYKFTWNGKGEALRISQTPSMGTLRPAPEEGESKNWDSTENLYIEGDNLEVLKLLQKSYFGKIKMIYIDPPYNTGNDFVYKDNYKDNIENYKKITGQVDGEGNTTTTNPEYSGRYHTDWLNMMYPRLRLARNLLTDDGVIFISIDDNEVHNLRKICDEVFGGDNFIACFKWNKTSTPPSLSNKFRGKYEYILCYEKNRNNTRYNGGFTDGGDVPLLNRGNPRARILFKKDYVEFKVDGNFPANEYGRIELLDDIIVTKGRADKDFSIIGEFKWIQETVDKEMDLGTRFLIKSDNFSIRFQRKDRKIKPPADVISKTECGVDTNEAARKELDKLVSNNEMDYPKPTSLIRYLLRFTESEDKNDFILDFFSGSATTAHAVMDLNAEDNGNRKFIMVQLPEPTDEKSEAYKAGYKDISEIGKERIRRAGDKIKLELEEKYEKASEEERKNMKNPDELDIGFKVFKLDSSNIKEWNPGKYENIQLAIEDSTNPYVEGRTENDVVYEMMLKMGVDLTYPVEKHEVNGKTIYSIGFGYLMICLSDNIDSSIAEKMIKIKDEHNQNEFRTIFRDEGFNSDTDKTNIKETLKSAGLAEESFITL